jgi:hypothetical protein
MFLHTGYCPWQNIYLEVLWVVTPHITGVCITQFHQKNPPHFGKKNDKWVVKSHAMIPPYIT